MTRSRRTLVGTLIAAPFVAALWIVPNAAAATKSLTANVPLVQSSRTLVVMPRRAAAFRLRLRVSSNLTARVFLTGANAPRSSAPILQTGAACEGAAGSVYCEAAFEALPAGTYRFRIVTKGRGAGAGRQSVTLTVRW